MITIIKFILFAAFLFAIWYIAMSITEFFVTPTYSAHEIEHLPVLSIYALEFIVLAIYFSSYLILSLLPFDDIVREKIINNTHYIIPAILGINICCILGSLINAYKTFNSTESITYYVALDFKHFIDIYNVEYKLDKVTLTEGYCKINNYYVLFEHLIDYIKYSFFFWAKKNEYQRQQKEIIKNAQTKKTEEFLNTVLKDIDTYREKFMEEIK